MFFLINVFVHSFYESYIFSCLEQGSWFPERIGSYFCFCWFHNEIITEVENEKYEVNEEKSKKSKE